MCFARQQREISVCTVYIQVNVTQARDHGITESDSSANTLDTSPSREAAAGSNRQGCANAEEHLHTLLRNEDLRNKPGEANSSSAIKTPTLHSLRVRGAHTAGALLQLLHPVSPPVPSVSVKIGGFQLLPRASRHDATGCRHPNLWRARHSEDRASEHTRNLTPTLPKYRGPRTDCVKFRDAIGDIWNRAQRQCEWTLSFYKWVLGKKERTAVGKAYLPKRVKDESTQCGPCSDFNKVTGKITF